MIQIETKILTLSHIENNCHLKNAKSPNLVLSRKKSNFNRLGQDGQKCFMNHATPSGLPG